MLSCSQKTRLKYPLHVQINQQGKQKTRSPRKKESIKRILRIFGEKVIFLPLSANSNKEQE
jgi:hypothetical protein